MEVGDAQTQFGRGLETAGWRVHADCRRGEGVVGWELEDAPVLAVGVGGVGGSGEDVVPFEDVGFGGVRDYVGWGCCLDGCVFAGEPAAGGGGCHCEKGDRMEGSNERVCV